MELGRTYNHVAYLYAPNNVLSAARSAGFERDSNGYVNSVSPDPDTPAEDEKQ